MCSENIQSDVIAAGVNLQLAPAEEGKALRSGRLDALNLTVGKAHGRQAFAARQPYPLDRTIVSREKNIS